MKDQRQSIMNISFVLKDPKSEKETLIYLLYRFQNKRLKYSTTKKIHPQEWNAETQLPHKTRSTVANFLKNMRKDAAIISERIESEGQLLTPEILKHELNLCIGKTSVDESQDDFFTFNEANISGFENNPAKGTIKDKKQTLSVLKDYEKKYRTKLSWQKIDIDFYYSFVNYLQNERHLSLDAKGKPFKNLSVNSIGKHIKNLKAFLSYAEEVGIKVNPDYKKKAFKGMKEDVENIYLSESEIDILYSLNLSKRPGLERVRDLFIIACRTGLRFSDISRLTEENIYAREGKQFIKIKTQKTGETVVIPVHHQVQEIINKYDGKLPKAIASQKMNEYLKEIGKKAEMTEPVQITEAKKGFKLTNSKQKYELISTHTARRSFATNMFKAGFPTIAIMKITGHKSEKTFLSYIKVSEEENAIMLSQHEYFTGVGSAMKVSG
jgi:integrase